MHAQNTQRGIVKSEFIFEEAPFPSSHASTICEVEGSLLAAWFGGTQERGVDVGIWLSRNDGAGWTAPVEVANGRNEKQRIQYPCWNPVLFQPKSGPLLLFYKVGPSPSSWWGMLKTSADSGQNWSEAKRLPKNIMGAIVGPVRNKPIELHDGTLLCGASTEDAGWRVHMEWTKDLGKSWSRTRELNLPMQFGAIQPTILPWSNGRLQILCRTKQAKIVESWSSNQGRTWTPLKATDLPNPNSAIDAVRLADGRALLVYNHSVNLAALTGDKSQSDGREVMNVAISPDGQEWKAAVVLEKEPGGEFSYPAVIQSSDGLVHVTYTWKRKRIKHLVLDPAQFVTRDIVKGQWVE